MTPYLFRIIKSDRKSWLKFLMCKKAPWSTFSISDLVSGTNLTLNNTIRRELAEINIMGNSIQDGEPSPENPVPINSIGDNVNLYDYTFVTGNQNNPYNNSGCVVTQTNGNYTLVPTARDAYFWQVRNEGLSYLPISAGKLYDFDENSYTISIISKSNFKNNYVTYYDENQVSLGYAIKTNNQFTINKFDKTGAKYFSLRFGVVDTTLNIPIEFTIKLEQGSIASPYSPYGMGCASIKKTNIDNTQSKTYIIPTRQPMRSIGEIRDDFVRQNGVWYERHKIGKKILDGTENYDYGDSGVSGIKMASFLIQDMLKGNFLDGLSNYFHNDKNGKAKNSIRFGANTNRIYIHLDEEEYPDKATFTSWLSTHNLEVYYPLAEPILLPCTNEQVAVLEEITTDPLYAEQTNFFSNDEVPTYLEVKYWKENI